ncbi:unnamed protein product [Schistosoma margrebowiei]|uniref:Uncharacterized protein n=1 Tax=Schistosoma margrebowiei TaxID=48269 RepID=A0A3P8B0F5_9TREM|nr:unnamed protein product [Schistosoma margrebowiei]
MAIENVGLLLHGWDLINTCSKHIVGSSLNALIPQPINNST